MLHNSGPYGPNDVPINMGMPVNMTQMSNPINLGNNLGNLGKTPQQAPQTTAPAYDMPDYASFSRPPLNMGHPMTPFPNYHPLNFQTSYGHSNPNLPHNTTPRNLEHSTLPMNLNAQSDHGPSLTNYHNFDSKKFDINNAQYRENVNKKVPINIPQIHTKAFQKHLGMDTNNSQFNSAQENPYSHDLSKPSEKSLIDSSRRKSLENTVKLIENILINSTPKDKSKNMESFSHSTSTNHLRNLLQRSVDGNKDEHNINQSSSHRQTVVHDSNTTDLQTTHSNTTEANSDIQNLSINLSSKKPEQLADVNPNMNKDDTKSSKQNDTKTKNLSKIKNTKLSVEKETGTKIQSEIHSEPLRRSLIHNNRRARDEEPREENVEMDSENEELIPAADIKKEIIEEDVVQIKVELVECSDIETSSFLRDTHATTKDSLEADAVVIDSNNVAEAKEAVKKGSNPKAYFECSHCNLLFNHPKRFLIHTKWHTFGLTSEKLHRLEKERELRKTMKREARIVERLNVNEAKEGEEGDRFPCKDCDKVFSIKNSLKNHRQKYHPTRVRECKICKQSVVGWMALRAHLATHAAGAGYACPDCPKRFKYAHSLAKHRDTHLEKTHSCDQCSKKFGSQALLKMHMKCHERTARGATFRCTYCGKGFFESYNLQVHERTHRNERPFTCDICKTSFGTNSSLKRHLKVSHSTSKPFSCDICHRSFASSTTRARHISRVHGDSSAFPHKCTLCPRQYSANKELQKHIGKVHKEERDRGDVG